MQHLMVDFIMSLDGYGAAEGWPGLWGMGGPEYLGWLEEGPEYTALFGRKTYEMLAGYAEEMPDDVGLAKMTRMNKVVFSSTLSEPLPWANTELVSGDAVEAVRAMKKDADMPLHTIGSLSLVRTLLEAGLVDRYRVVVFPVINGATGQDRLFDDYPDVRLELVEHRLFDGRLQLLEYEPTVLDGPPGA